MIDRQRMRALLQPCIDLLARREREYLVSRYRWLVEDDEPEELTPEEVAEKLSAEQGRNVTRNAINRTIHSARLKIKRCLEDRNFTSPDDVIEEAS
jgi:DNA-directed RNA polymerase specialized sigma24 family protein